MVASTRAWTIGRRRCGEAFAAYVFDYVESWLIDAGHSPRVHLISVECREHGGKLVIVAYRPAPGVSKEQEAGLAAHEAMHAVQYINKHVSHHQRFCDETEAYLVQAITQGLLSELWKGRKRATTP